MTPKEKADVIFNDFYHQILPIGNSKKRIVECAKQCAIISCKEAITALDNFSMSEYGHTKIDIGQIYYVGVIKEIESL